MQVIAPRQSLSCVGFFFWASAFMPARVESADDAFLRTRSWSCSMNTAHCSCFCRSLEVEIVNLPEPSTYAMLGVCLSLAALMWWRRLRTAKAAA
jgi:hypothetical protein